VAESTTDSGGSEGCREGDDDPAGRRSRVTLRASAAGDEPSYAGFAGLAGPTSPPGEESVDMAANTPLQARFDEESGDGQHGRTEVVSTLLAHWPSGQAAEYESSPDGQAHAEGMKGMPSMASTTGKWVSGT
jgi:hypothetical protein